MATIPLINAIVFSAYGHGKDMLHKLQKKERPLNSVEIGLAGAYAGPATASQSSIDRLL